MWLVLLGASPRAPPSRCSGLVALTEPLTVPPFQLSELNPGDVLERCEVKSSHGNKLFLSVPVVLPQSKRGARRLKTLSAQGLEPKTLNAQLNLPHKHPAAKDPATMVGRKLDVYVRRANLDDGTLQVSLFKFDHLSRDTRGRQAANQPLRLEELATGQAVRGVVLSCHAFGCFVEVGVSRPGRHGRREPVDALLPLNQLAEGLELLEETKFGMLVWPERTDGAEAASRRLRVGSTVEARVLQPTVGTGKLVLTMGDAAVEVLEAGRRERRGAQKRKARRPSLGDKKLAAGAEREGVVVDEVEQGVVVNVGAKVTGLVPFALVRGGADAAPQRGTRVLVKVRKESTATALRLSLVRVLGEDDTPGASSSLALQRRGERVQPYERAEDAAMGVRPPRPPAAPAGSRQTDGGEEEEEEEEEEDPFAWAMQDQAEDSSSSAAGAEEDEDPFAWAAAAAQGQSDGGDGDGGGGSGGRGGGEDDDLDGSWAKSDEPDFSDNYLEDKYG